MISKKLQKYLEKNEITADVITHRTVYTAYDLAQTTKLKLEQIAKTLLLKVEPFYGENKSKYVLAVLSASYQCDFAKLKKILKVKKVSLPKESVMAKQFKVKMGAITPFGVLHKDTPVIIDKSLTKVKKIVVRSGSFTESLLMKTKDFLKATAGEVAVFAKSTKRK